MTTAFVALLCGVNVGGNRKVPMADLCDLVAGLGFTGAKTYIQSGNVVFKTKGSTHSVETKLEAALLARFGFAVEALVRTGDEWKAHAAGNPFAKEAESEPNRVMMLVSRSLSKPDAATTLLARATAGEQVKAGGGALWIYYPQGAGTTKLTPSLADRLVGSKVTARNWRTVVELRNMASP